jgi:hypothetical protein
MSGGPDTPHDRWGPGRGHLAVSSQDRVPVVGMAKVVGGAGAVGPVAARRIPTAVADPPQIPQEPGHDGRNTMQEHKIAPSPDTTQRRYTGVRGIWLNQHWSNSQNSPIGPGVQRMKRLQRAAMARTKPRNRAWQRTGTRAGRGTCRLVGPGSSSGSRACTHTCSVCREIPRSAAIPRSVAPGDDRYRSTAWRRNSSV